MVKQTKRVRPFFVVGMIKLAMQIDKVKNVESLIRSTLQYGKCGHMKRDEVEWVLNHSFATSIKKEWALIAAARKRTNYKGIKQHAE